MESFSTRVIKRAFKETWAYVGITPQSVLAAFYLAVGTAVYLWLAGLDKVMEEWSSWVSFVAAPTIAFAVLLFLWNLFLSPFRLIDEKFDKVLQLVTQSNQTRLRMFNFEPPDFQAWKKLGTARIFEIARLCAEEDPHSSPVSGREQVYVQHMIEGVRNGSIARADGQTCQVSAITEDNPTPEVETYFPPLNQSARVVIDDVARYFKTSKIYTVFFDQYWKESD